MPSLKQFFKFLPLVSTQVPLPLLLTQQSINQLMIAGGVIIKSFLSLRYQLVSDRQFFESASINTFNYLVLLLLLVDYRI